jgi:hypothetical protein
MGAVQRGVACYEGDFCCIALCGGNIILGKEKVMEERINGIYSARVMPNGAVEWNFTPTGNGCGTMRLILAPGVGYIQGDLVTTFGVQPERAKAVANELAQKGIVDVAASVDPAILPKLVVQCSVA